MIEQTSIYFNLIILSELIRTIAIVLGVLIAYHVHKDKLRHNPRLDNDNNKRERRLRK